MLDTVLEVGLAGRHKALGLVKALQVSLPRQLEAVAAKAVKGLLHAAPQQRPASPAQPSQGDRTRVQRKDEFEDDELDVPDFLK